jgi:acetylornithine/succinyldiaminopimelate/putrescine aminotransferase
LDIIETDDLSRNARERGAQAIAAVNSLNSPFVRSVRGKGLLIGIELDADRFAPHVAPGSTPALELTNRLIAEGLLVPPAGPNVIRWLPPLNVSSDEIDRAAEKLGSALAKIR